MRKVRESILNLSKAAYVHTCLFSKKISKNQTFSELIQSRNQIKIERKILIRYTDYINYLL